MTKEQVIEGNKLIAEFSLSNAPYYLMPNRRQYLPSGLLYYNSWDWQIPVWEKIGHLMQQYVSKDEVPISAVQEYNRLCNKYESAVFTNNPQKGFQTLLESITWFNTQKQT